MVRDAKAEQLIVKKNEDLKFNYDILVTLKKELKAYGPDKTLTFEDTIDKLCYLARYPVIIEPGDWFITRPKSLKKNKPSPRCREYLWGHLEPRTAKNDEKSDNLWKKKEKELLATLPHNHIFGPVHRVSFHEEDGIWQLMVLVDSIFNDKDGEKPLKAWVTISNGTTQWARWQTCTDTRFRLPPSHPSIARGDPGGVQIEMPRGMYGDGRDGVERWQDNVPIHRLIKEKERYWTILPCSGREDYKPWLRKFALQTLRHDNLQEAYDGAVHFPVFLKTMTRKVWSYNRDECTRVCRSPLHLLQALMMSSPTPTFGGAWF